MEGASYENFNEEMSKGVPEKGSGVRGPFLKAQRISEEMERQCKDKDRALDVLHAEALEEHKVRGPEVTARQELDEKISEARRQAKESWKETLSKFADYYQLTRQGGKETFLDTIASSATLTDNIFRRISLELGLHEEEVLDKNPAIAALTGKDIYKLDKVDWSV